ncbi:alkaline phosphatase family protein [Nocardia cyriacigeorgica]|uniref:alkaline phosphatase family protein n=1 Tax=Nocardia cyriacigeorgica TaxID=135487 RepID=UPI0018956D72|nr:nucleotide pyrophosphatase/phosphodiesterase family protein [Nocardia cyriacigeorgica]MBF6088262.1 alkaline phosphatase family protein [Nocardia cyriacigeorgica]MBF6095371.1 alkaline phosphatase family protein [Nocardia cyriacigeorgica]MBF6322998.1 alkaline phosphatase family protein [Nocardia cyriacigeorgica]MBF6396553.1 alkaline phosphatase family protein [Nocardia cyriacigeorgica]MBF6402185.1 alkaline phosphatase family protein [Nocardia cyriacigeorgica]
MFVAPRYGTGSLSDLFPSVLAGFEVPGEHDRLGLELGVDRVCVLLIDGLGAEALAEHAEVAPFLSGLSPAVLTAGFPTTTATSLSSLGAGVPPGEHGIVGYLLRVPGQDRLFDPLGWRLFGGQHKGDLLEQLVPEQFQPGATVFERAVAHGLTVTQVAPRYQAGSGLTRAVLRGCAFRPNFSVGDLVAGVVEALAAGPRSLVYAYHGELDTTGHVRGPSSQAWLLELAHVDRIAADIAARMPAGSALIVTADHGMVELGDTIDFDAEPGLREGVHRLGGEPRARHVYTADGAVDDVMSAWRERLGTEFQVLPRAEVIDRGWFGPMVSPQVRERIGNLVVVARDSGGVVRTQAEPLQSALPGHHGSLTPAEMNVPLRVFTS